MCSRNSSQPKKGQHLSLHAACISLCCEHCKSTEFKTGDDVMTCLAPFCWNRWTSNATTDAWQWNVTACERRVAFEQAFSCMSTRDSQCGDVF